ncbi:universal stress protein [Saccharomonospora sp. NPDC046836]|uniref:universal stress protein n=1 Tax=Saccharomonospora sp. NPDC046836 TaxID=3156921 RepID=UPI0033D66BB8
MPSSGRIVVGIDGSKTALHAVRWATGEARRRGRGLRLVHAIDNPLVNYPRAMPKHAEIGQLLWARGERLLGEARELVAEVAPEVDVEVAVLPDSVTSALVAESELAELLVLGTWGLTPVGRVLVGSATIALVAHAACPVAVVRGHTSSSGPPLGGTVVVGVDSPATDDDVLAAAFDEASARGTTLTVVHVWHDALLADVLAEGGWQLDRQDVEERERDRLTERLAGWQQKYPDVRVERLVLRGRAGDRLARLGDHAQLLVVGSRGRGGIAGMLLGSTSQAVIMHANCPVLVVRPRRRAGTPAGL